MPQDSDVPPSPRQPKTARCAHCGRRFEYIAIREHQTFPFCSPRCRQADLGNWLSGRYVIPGQPLPPEAPDEEHEST